MDRMKAEIQKSAACDRKQDMYPEGAHMRVCNTLEACAKQRHHLHKHGAHQRAPARSQCRAKDDAEGDALRNFVNQDTGRDTLSPGGLSGCQRPSIEQTVDHGRREQGAGKPMQAGNTVA